MHQPVLLRETLAALRPEEGGIFLDATFGGGGHARAIGEALKKSGDPKATLLLSDRDASTAASMEDLQQILSPLKSMATHLSFSQLETWLQDQKLQAHGLQGLLFDLGVSSMQLDEAERGFSFLRSGPLDMRMDDRQTLTAAAWLAEVDEATLREILFRYGEEPRAAAIAASIVKHRAEMDLSRTDQLASLVARVAKNTNPKRHPATQTFQAIRMVINEEMDELWSALQLTATWMSLKGSSVLLTFQGLEVRAMRQFLQSQEASREVDGTPCVLKVDESLTPTRAEVQLNHRSRSAKLWHLRWHPLSERLTPHRKARSKRDVAAAGDQSRGSLESFEVLPL